MKTFNAILTTLTLLSFSVMGQDKMSRTHHVDSTKVEKPVPHKQHHDVKKNVKKIQHYTCPMHSEVITGKPGKCPKCGMTLVKLEPKKVKEIVSEVYTCPMHPEVKSDKPGKCPICKMHLVKEKKVN